MNFAVEETNHLAESLASLRAAMAPEAVARADRLACINKVYVRRTKKDQELSEALDSLVESVAAAATGAPAKKRALFVVGASGSGKTTSIREHLSKRPEFQPRVTEDGEIIRPMVSFDAPKPLTLKLLARKGIEAIGYPIVGDLQENQMWDLFKHQLKERRVLFLHIDEMQHVIRGNKQSEIQNIADVLKSLLQIPGWPLHLVFSGVPVLAKFLDTEEQLRNRSMILELEQMSFPKHAKAMSKVVTRIIETDAAMRLDGVTTDEMVHRLIRATNGAFGTMVQFVRAAVETELHAGSDTVSVKSFAKVYRRFTGCRSNQNMFESSDWRTIVPANALANLVASCEAAEDLH